MSRDFWSRRRAAVQAEQEAELEAVRLEEQAEDEARTEAQDDEAVLARLELPAPEEIDTPDDLRKLLDSGIPKRLRQRALRRMWRLNPVLANLDGLLEYGEDYTDAATVVDDLKTTYQVGRGMLRALEKIGGEEGDDTPDAAAEAEDETPVALTEAPQDTPVSVRPPELKAQAVWHVTPPASTAPTTPSAQVQDTVAQDTLAEDAPLDAAPLAARRMRFRFAEG